MITKSVSEARRHLGELIELARDGEEVVIIKDSRPAAALIPIDDSDLELAAHLSDRQARKLLEMAEEEPSRSFDTPQAAARYLKRRLARKR